VLPVRHEIQTGIEANPLNLGEEFFYVAGWILSQGWVEIGSHETDDSMARALDDGRAVFIGGGAEFRTSLEKALTTLDNGIKASCEEYDIDLMKRQQ
jgi:hypothetical protein